MIKEIGISYDGKTYVKVENSTLVADDMKGMREKANGMIARGQAINQAADRFEKEKKRDSRIVSLAYKDGNVFAGFPLENEDDEK